MLMTVNPQSEPSASRQTGQGLVMAADRSREFEKAARRTMIVRLLRIVFPGAIVALLGVYGIAIAQKTGLVSPDALPEVALRQILPADLAMTNPRYEGFGKDGVSYKFTAKTADPDLTNPNVVTLNGISGEIYQADKTRTDVTAVRGVFNNNDSVLELYEQIDVVSESGLKAKLTRATILAKEDLLTSPEPVAVAFPSGTVHAKQMTLRQKAREATFTEDVQVELSPPPDDQPKPEARDAAAAEPASDAAALFTPSNGPIHINSHRLDINDANKTALFSGSVRARQGDADLTTPELEVFYEGEGMMSAGSAAEGENGAGRLRRILAKKPVVMQRATGEIVTSDSADFDAVTSTAVLLGDKVVMTSGVDRHATSRRVELNEASGMIVLIGDVVVTQGTNELRGGRLAVDRNRLTARLTSPPEASVIPGRISARLIRDANDTGGTTAATPAAQGIGAMSFKADPKSPVDVTSESLDVDDGKKVAVFRGSVEAAQGAVKIQSAELSAYYKGEAGLMDAAGGGAGAANTQQGAGSELTRIEARKDVKVTAADGQTATGDWANFDAKTNKITMGGNVVLSQGQSMVRGTRLLIDLTSGESKIDTAPGNTVAVPNGGGWSANTESAAESGPARKAGRASAVFFPQEMKEGQKKNSKAKRQTPEIDGWSATSEPNP
ncbi:LPS export ABC transporter periplasmic protein LptC [Hyphomicrobium nitrativorans]|nr:LPS export ABC transporter periplasmic protein LptC [Hyphomicrobium nitrativorans]